MNVSRRQVMALSAGAAVAAVVGWVPAPAFADATATEKKIMEFTGGKTPQSGKVSLTAPEIAENGNTVPISVAVESDMSDKSYVESVLILADGNPNPNVARFNFTPMSGEAAASTRMRLAKTQNVIAVAKMNDGSVYMQSKQVKVTIGGCGG
jgi:sulfur-oxidizing protein SoxY